MHIYFSYLARPHSNKNLDLCYDLVLRLSTEAKLEMLCLGKCGRCSSTTLVLVVLGVCCSAYENNLNTKGLGSFS